MDKEIPLGKTKWVEVRCQDGMDKKALAAVLSDSTLTSGANFGFGWWSAGENNRDGGYCDKNGKYCNYWSGWNYAANEHRDCKK